MTRGDKDTVVNITVQFDPTDSAQIRRICRMLENLNVKEVQDLSVVVPPVVAPPVVAPPLAAPPVVAPSVVAPPLAVPPLAAPPLAAPPLAAPPLAAPPLAAPPLAAPPLAAPPVVAPPVVAPPPPFPGAVSSEVDVAGHPWDSELHAATKSKTKDGRWRRKRGVTAEDVDARCAPVVPPVAAPPVVPPVAAPPVVPPVAAPPVVPPVAAPPVVPPGGHAALSWDNVFAEINARVGRYTPEQVQGALAAKSLDVATLVNEPQHYATAIQALKLGCPR